MYEIYLTSDHIPGIEQAHPERVENITFADTAEEAHDICVVLQPYLREGIEAHFVSNDTAPAGNA